MKTEKTSALKRCILIVAAIMLMSLFSAVSTSAAEATTASAAYKTYTSILANNSSNYVAFGTLYLNNDSIPDLIAVKNDEKNSRLSYVIYINGTRFYYEGHPNYVLHQGYGKPCYYYPKKGVLVVTLGTGSSYYLSTIKIGSVYDLFRVLGSGKFSTGGKTYDYVLYCWGPASGNATDTLRNVYCQAVGATYSSFQKDLELYAGSTARKQVTFYENTAANRSNHLKAASQKSQTITTKATKYYTTYKYNKTFSLEASSKTSRTYSSNNTSVATVSSAGKVTVKGYGVATITIKAKATSAYKSASKTVYVYVKPVQAKITSAAAGNPGYIVVTWKKDSKATGYQVQYSANSSFSSPTTFTCRKNNLNRATINTKVKGKTFYVRVRSYKSTNGKTAYGPYSAVKKVTSGK